MSRSHALIESAQEILTLRLEMFKTRTAVRLSHHEIEQQLTVDTYAGHLLLTDYQNGADKNARRLARLHQIAGAFMKVLSMQQLPALSATIKFRPDNLSHTGGNVVSRVAIGEPTPSYWAIEESGMNFRISFSEGGFATGTFLDMAMGRRWVLENSRNAQVLNLFSYTGPFSIAAAMGGAERVIEVDTSRKWLNWAQSNQQLNEVTVIRQRHEDAVKFLNKQKPDQYDIVILDPPSYANPKKSGRFRAMEAYPVMVMDVERTLKPGGYALMCLNQAGVDQASFKRALGNRLKFERWLKPDHDFPQIDYLKVAVLRRSND